MTPIQEVLEHVARKLTELNDRSLLLGGRPITLQDPRDLAYEIQRRANMVANAAESGTPAGNVAEALGAYVVAYLLARARVEELDLTSGSDAA